MTKPSPWATPEPLRTVDTSNWSWQRKAGAMLLAVFEKVVRTLVECVLIYYVACILSWMWLWFVVPTFVGLPVLTALQVLCLRIFIQTVSLKTPLHDEWVEKEQKQTLEQKWQRIGRSVMLWSFVFALMWTLHHFFPI